MQRRFRKKEALAKRATSKVSFDDDNAAPTRIFYKNAASARISANSAVFAQNSSRSLRAKFHLR